MISISTRFFKTCMMKILGGVMALATAFVFVSASLSNEHGNKKFAQNANFINPVHFFMKNT